MEKIIFLIICIVLLKINNNLKSDCLSITPRKWQSLKLSTFQINLPVIEIDNFDSSFFQSVLLKKISDKLSKKIIINGIV
mgnify:FL=1